MKFFMIGICFILTIYSCTSDHQKNSMENLFMLYPILPEDENMLRDIFDKNYPKIEENQYFFPADPAWFKNKLYILPGDEIIVIHENKVDVKKVAKLYFEHNPMMALCSLHFILESFKSNGNELFIKKKELTERKMEMPTVLKLNLKKENQMQSVWINQILNSNRKFQIRPFKEDQRNSEQILKEDFVMNSYQMEDENYKGYWFVEFLRKNRDEKYYDLFAVFKNNNLVDINHSRLLSVFRLNDKVLFFFDVWVPHTGSSGKELDSLNEKGFTAISFDGRYSN